MAKTVDKPSLHLTFGIHPFYWVDVLKAILDLVAIREPLLRRALPPGFTYRMDDHGSIVSECHNLIQLSLAQVTPEAALDLLTKEQMNASVYPPDGHFAQLTGLEEEELSLDAVICHRAGILCQVESTIFNSSISFALNKVEAPPIAGPALMFIRDHECFQVYELPNLDDHSKIVLIRRLIREGFLRRERATLERACRDL